MRKEAGLLSKLTFSYPKPLLDTAMEGDICFEQYGELPDELKIKHSMTVLEQNMQYYLKTEPESKNSVIKAIFATNGWMFAFFVVCKLILTVLELAIPILMKEFITFMEEDNPPEYMTSAWAVKVGIALLAIKVFKHTLWENLCYKMVLVGHTAHTTLKAILFGKTFRMSNATNKDYSSGEIMNLIHRDAGRVWSFVWDLSTIIETPIEMTVAAYFLWTNLGWCAFTGLGVYAALWQVNKYKSKLHRKTWRVVDRKRDKRHTQTSEAFHNAKMLKLYGWEQKFQASVTDLYQEEQRMQRE